MALFDLSNELRRADFSHRVEYLMEKRCVVELSERRPPRTNAQNRYLHAIFGYFGSQVGETMDDVKLYYFKIECNPSIFISEVESKVTGRKQRRIRSTSELTTEEMTIAIERFRDWSAKTAGLYIPSPNEHRLVMQMEIEANKYKQYI